MGKWKFKPEKLCKESERWNKTFESHEEDTVDEAGTSNTSGRRGWQNGSNLPILYSPSKRGGNSLSI